MSTFTVTGNLTDTPVLRFTPSGKAVANFTVAENRKRGDEDVTHFFDCVAWDTLAENCAESLEKGARVVVTGRMEQRSWTDNDGNKRSKLEVVTDEVGPSLRWASAQVTKNERRSDGASNYRDAAPAGASAPRPAPRPAVTEYDDEAPF